MIRTRSDPSKMALPCKNWIVTPLAQGQKPVCQLIDNLVLPRPYFFQVDLRFTESDAHIAGALGIVQELGKKKKRLGRNTSAKQALTPRPALQIDQRDFHPQIGCSECGRVTSRPCANDEDLGFMASTLS